MKMTEVERITDLNKIVFPKLGWSFSIDTTAFTVFGMEIKWYGLIITCGLFLAMLYCFPKMKRFGLDSDRVIDVVICGVLGGIVGARIYYVINEWDEYAGNWKEIFNTRNGGLAIYGGLIGGIAVAIIVCIVEKINIPNLLDLCGMSFLIGQGIGRWGNFANQEAFGTNTDLPWGMYSEKTKEYLEYIIKNGTSLTVDPSKPVHPTFLYESLWCLLSFLIIFVFYKKCRKFSGQLFLLYGILYGAERAVVEGLRTDSLYIPGTELRTSQVFSICFAAVCLVLFIVLTVKYTRNPKPIEGVDYYREIPLYNKKKKAFIAKKEWQKLQSAADTAEITLSFDPGNKKLIKKCENAKKKAVKAQSAYVKAQAVSDAKDAERAAKKAKKSKA